MERAETGMKTKAMRPLLVQYGSQESRESGFRSSLTSVGAFAPTNERPRSALKIRLDILETLRDKGPSKLTTILTTANLSYNRLVKYLGELVSQGLLNETEDSAKSYALTAKGLDFVNQVKEIEAFVAGFGLAL